jgi:hypothetical protein
VWLHEELLQSSKQFPLLFSPASSVQAGLAQWPSVSQLAQLFPLSRALEAGPAPFV